jgi:dienelactone hydrolase
MGAHRRAALVVALSIVGACSTTNSDPADDVTVPATSATSDVDVEVDVDVEFDVDLGGVTTGDVFASAGSDLMDAPVVVMLHGTAGDRTRMHDIARRVATDDVLVYVPDWPSIDQVYGYPSDDDEPYREQADVLVCALRYIRRTTAERGGDPDDITVYGHSGGAMAGARVAMVLDPPWSGIDCDAGTSHVPRRFIGSAGDYEGLYQLSSVVPDLYAPYDPLTIEPTNGELEVRLVHGMSDDSVSADVSSAFLGHLLANGIDARMISTDSAHGALIDPSTPAGEFMAEQIVALVRGEPSAFDDEGEPATMVYDGSCRYDGPSTFDVGRPIDVEFATPDGQVWLLAFSVLPDATETDDEIMEREGVPLGEPPDFVDFGGIQLIDQPGSEIIRLVFLEDDQRWVLACVPVETTDTRWPASSIPRLAVVLSPSV